MGEFTGTTTVSVPAATLFDYLSDVGNLPRYFARMTSAQPGEGEEVHTTAKMPDGTEVEGDAWFRVDESAHRIEWGSEGPTGDGSEVEVGLHTTRVPDGDDQVQDGIAETLARIKEQAEGA